MRPSKFIAKMLLFSPIIKKYLSISTYLPRHAWPHVSPCAHHWVAVQMRLDTVILAAGTVRIATPLTETVSESGVGGWGPDSDQSRIPVSWTRLGLEGLGV